MAKIVVKETVTKEREIDISLKSFISLIDSLSMEDRRRLLKVLSAAIEKGRPVELTPFKKDRLEKVVASFAETNLYEPEFLRELEAGLKKSSIYSK
jgi:hypothetical protein